MIECSPIKDIYTIEKIKDLYKKKNRQRDLLLFELGINTGLRLNELLNLKVNDVINKHYLVNKKQTFFLNEELRSLISSSTINQKGSEYLFQSRTKKQIDRSTVFCSFKEICSELALPQDISVASWRKTFAYHHYQRYKDLSYLQWLFNQATVEQTLRFIGINENMNLRFREGVCL